MSSLLSTATLSTIVKSEQSTKKMILSPMVNGGQHHQSYRKLDETEMTPVMLAEYRRLQHELQCQEAMLVLMQKLKSNQRLVSTTNNNNSNSVKQRPVGVNATKLSVQNQQQSQQSLVDSKSQLIATKQSQQQPVYHLFILNSLEKKISQPFFQRDLIWF